jgi:translation initiation factor 1A
MASAAGKRDKERAEAQKSAMPTRVPTPKEGEVIGIVEQRVGGNRMIVKCLDGKERNCRIPGGRRRKLWIRAGDTLIVQPWEFEGDKKADVLLKYTPAQVNWLKRKGILKEIESEF